MGVFRLSFYKWLIVGCLTFSAKYFLHNQDENKLTNTYMNYTKLRGEWYNQDENKLTNTYMNYTIIIRRNEAKTISLSNVVRET